jgi:hypothetical protein
MSMITADCYACRWQDKTVTLSRAEDDHGRVGEIRRGSGRPARLRGRPGSPSSSTLLDRTLSRAFDDGRGQRDTRAHTHRRTTSSPFDSPFAPCPSTPPKAVRSATRINTAFAPRVSPPSAEMAATTSTATADRRSTNAVAAAHDADMDAGGEDDPSSSLSRKRKKKARKDDAAAAGPTAGEAESSAAGAKKKQAISCDACRARKCVSPLARQARHVGRGRR